MAKIRIRNVRLAFPALFEPKAFAGEDKAAYSAAFILDGKDDPVVEVGRATPDGKTDWSMKAKLSEVMLSVAKEKWGAKGEATFKALKAGDKICLHDGDAKAQYAGFEGNNYISARNPNTKPRVVDQRNVEVDQASGIVYAGCYVHAVLEIYAQDNAYGKRINASIATVMFAKDGEAFGGGARGSAADFDDLAVEDSVDDLA